MEDKRIPDSNLNASSYEYIDYSASSARLNLADYSWNPNTNDNKPWLQVDFGRKVSIVQVASQGEEGARYWVERYTLSYIAVGQEFVDLNQVNCNVILPFCFACFPFFLKSSLLAPSSKQKNGTKTKKN